MSIVVGSCCATGRPPTDRSSRSRRASPCSRSQSSDAASRCTLASRSPSISAIDSAGSQGDNTDADTDVACASSVAGCVTSADVWNRPSGIRSLTRRIGTRPSSESAAPCHRADEGSSCTAPSTTRARMRTSRSGGRFPSLTSAGPSSTSAETSGRPPSPLVRASTTTGPLPVSSTPPGVTPAARAASSTWERSPTRTARSASPDATVGPLSRTAYRPRSDRRVSPMPASRLTTSSVPPSYQMRAGS